MSVTLPAIEELVRIPAPCPAPIGLAYDGAYLWIGSVETNCIYAFDPHTGSMLEHWAAPGTPYGMTVVGTELRVVVGVEPDDDRSIARLIPGHGFKTETVACPDHTGVWLGYDGDALFVGQRFNKKIFELDDAGGVIRVIPIERECTGMTIVDGCFYMMTTESKEVDDYRLTRLDARGAKPMFTEIAAVDFVARGLAFDGTSFWTNVRGENTLVSFALPR